MKVGNLTAKDSAGTEAAGSGARRLSTRLRRRRGLLGGLSLLMGVGAGVAGYAIFREPLHVHMDHLKITLPNANGHLPAQGLRILHLSDTHFRGENWREQAKIGSIRRACAGLDYDLLIHTGDFLHYDSGLPNVLALLDGLPRPRLGAYAVFGNHDYTTYSHKDMFRRSWTRFQGKDERFKKPLSWVDRAQLFARFWYHFVNAPLDLKRTGHNDVATLEQALQARNIQTLHNRYIRLSHVPHQPDGVDIYIAGVDDVTEGHPRLRQALGEIPYDAPTILLSHNPDILQEPEIDQVDLVLAGHTHGGQVVLPWIGAAHTQSTFLRRAEVAGHLRRGKTQIYITRGIGEGIPVRLGAAPQITLITVSSG
ncbi:MAG: metallophosphoesterase [Caldilineaceae bacterium]|nr:metallophosphoesterase [Caldilineaceae bacterium]